MKPRAQLGELALMLQEARRRNPGAYRILGLASGLGEKKVKAVAHGLEPEEWERAILSKLARG